MLRYLKSGVRYESPAPKGEKFGFVSTPTHPISLNMPIENIKIVKPKIIDIVYEVHI